MIQRFFSLIGLDELEGRNPSEIRCVFLTVLMSVFLISDSVLEAPNVKLIMAEFNRSAAAVGLIASIFVLSGTAVGILSGYLAGRANRKYVAAAAVGLGTIPCILTGYIHTYEQLLMVRVLTGIGIGGIMPQVYSLVGDLVSDRKRSTAASFIGLAEGMGMAYGMLLGGYIGETNFQFLGTYGWRLAFVLNSIPNIILVPLFLLTTTEPQRGSGEASLRGEIEAGGQYRHRIALRDYLQILKIRTNVNFFLQAIPGTVAWGVLPYWIITYFATERNVHIATATYITVLIGIGAVIGGFAGGLIGDRIQRRGRHYLCYLCGTATTIGLVLFLIMIHYPLPAAPQYFDMFPPFGIVLLAGFVMSLTTANIRAVVLNVNTPEDRGAMMSLTSLVEAMGKGGGPVLGGLLIGLFGYRVTMDIAALFWVPCAFIYFFLMPKYYPRDAQRLDDLLTQRAGEMHDERVRREDGLAPAGEGA